MYIFLLFGFHSHPLPLSTEGMCIHLYEGVRIQLHTVFGEFEILY